MMAKRLGMIVLSFVFIVETISPSVDPVDFFHIADVWEHFEEHRLEHPDITLSAFLRLHYGASEHRKLQHEGHHTLPFSKRTHHHHNGLLPMPDLTHVYAAGSRSLLMTIEAVTYTGTYNPREAAPVWQPPKV